MACGVPVAAFPVTGPIDVVTDGVTGALDEDLHRAALRALELDPAACREHALKFGWDVNTRQFEGNLVVCQSAAVVDLTTAMQTNASSAPPSGRAAHAGW
jgi:hypothetical protein